MYEHTQRTVNDPEFFLGEPLLHKDAEQLIGKLYVVDAVVAVTI